MTAILRPMTQAIAFAILIGITSHPIATAAISDDRPDASPPGLGDSAPDFTLRSLSGKEVSLRGLTSEGPVVLLVLRGYPGYQCPICSRQVGEFLGRADDFSAEGAQVVMIYPGPADDLQEHAEQFISGKTLPDHFDLLIDPDYTFTNAYGLRWDAPRETAYPSAFVIGQDGVVRFAKVSRSHGGRASAEEVLDVLGELGEDEAGASAEARVSQVLRRVEQHDFHPVREGFTFDRNLDKHGVAGLDDDWRVRLLAVRDLVRLGNPAVPAIAARLRDEDWHVRQVAAQVLGILGAESAVNSLVEVLRGDPEPIVRSQAAVALGRINASEAVGPLGEAAEGDPSRDVRHQAELARYRVEREIRPDDLLENAYASLDEADFELLEVGKPAIDFELKDTKGRSWRLRDFLGKQPVVLIWIFADWCPVCHHEFADLIRLEDEFAEHDVQVFTLECHDTYRCRVMTGDELHPSYWFSEDSPQVTYTRELWWPHLVDLAGAVGASYGIDPMEFAVHSEYINRPSTVIIDEDGIVRFAYRGTYWGDRPSIEQILKMTVSGNYDFEHPDRLQQPSQSDQ